MVDYPSNPPAGAAEDAAFNNATTDPRMANAVVSPVPSGNYYGALASAAAQAQGSSDAGFGAAPAPSAPAAAPAPAAAGPASYEAALDQDFPNAVAMGQVPWEGLPSFVRDDLSRGLGDKAPAAYERARIATARTAPVTGVLGAERGVVRAPQPAPTRGFFDPVQESSGIGTGTLAGDVSKGLGNIMAGPGRDTPSPITGSPAQMFNQGFNGPPSPVAPTPPNVTGVAKNVPASSFPPGQLGAAPGARPGGPSGTIFPPSPPTSTFTPHADNRLGRFDFGPGPTGGGVTSNELTATDPFGQAQAEGAGVVGAAPVAGPAANIPGGGGLPAPPPGMPLPQPRPEINDLGSGTAPAEKTHIVLPGDTLWDIARDELGNPQRWQQIAAMNGISRSQVRHLQPGTPLKLPTSDADMPTPRQQPAITAPPGRASNLNDDSYYGGLANAAGPPFAGGADAQATSGSRDVELAALSANDNGPKGQSMIPGSRLPPAMQPNVLPDYFRGLKPLPVTKPANQANVSGRAGSNLLGGERGDRLLADYWRMANPEMPGSETNKDKNAINDAQGLRAGYAIDDVFGLPQGFPRYGKALEPNLIVRNGKVYRVGSDLGGG